MRRANLVAFALALSACGGGDDAATVDASPPDAVLGPISVTGTVRYEDRDPMPPGRLGPIQPVPARHVHVALIARDGSVLGETTTGVDGSYALVGNGPYGESVHVLVATSSDTLELPISVKRTDGRIHAFGAPDFEAQPNEVVDVLVTESSGEAGAFNVYDKLIDTIERVVALGENPAHLVAIWQRGSEDGTYYDPSANTMHLLGAASDDDGYDDEVILHEAGHYIEDTIGRSDSPGGFHDGSPTDPNLAWSEGFATFWAMAVQDAPLYIDTNAGGGWTYNADASVTLAPNPGGSMSQNVSEDMVSQILWDLADAPTSDDDPFVGTADPALAVQPDYLAVATLRTVGAAGVDLVDFLDGFFMADGLSHCAAVRTIVTTTRRFPYDYNGPAGDCF